MSDDGDDDNKTEDPTPKKLEEARKKGQVPLSREVNNWVMLSAGTLVVLSMGPQMMESIMTVLKTYIADTADLPAVPGGFVVVVAEAFKEIMRIVALPMVFLMAAAFSGRLRRSGRCFQRKPLRPTSASFHRPRVFRVCSRCAPLWSSSKAFLKSRSFRLSAW